MHSPSVVNGYEGLTDYLLEHNVMLPPCKPGDTVYVVYGDEIYRATVITLHCTIGQNFCQTDYCGFIGFADFGKSVFFTYKKAKKTIERSKAE